METSKGRLALSTYIGLHCSDCNEHSPYFIKLYALQEAKHLIEAAPDIQAILHKDVGRFLKIGLSEEYYAEDFHEVIDFIMEHGSHTLMVRDEYGNYH